MRLIGDSVQVNRLQNIKILNSYGQAEALTLEKGAGGLNNTFVVVVSVDLS
jgi:hypothetical protein